MNINCLKIYGILGTVLLGCAGAIIGYVTAGFSLAIVGTFAGALVGHLLQKFIVRLAFTKN